MACLHCRVATGKLKDELVAAQRAAAALALREHQRKRDEHFVSRFLNSLRAAEEGVHGATKKTVDATMVELIRRLHDTAGGRGSDSVVYLNDALEAVVQCRRALAWSYVEGYFIEEAKRPLFNHIQSELERFTDHLQEMLERRSREVMAASRSGTDVAAYLRDVNSYAKVIREHLARICDAFRSGLGEIAPAGAPSSS